jgi:hypothetical protein
MITFTFLADGEEQTVEAEDLEEVLKEASIEEGDFYKLIEGDDFEDKCFLSAISDEILFGS